MGEGRTSEPGYTDTGVRQSPIRPATTGKED
jgi:hypothetical protein